MDNASTQSLDLVKRSVHVSDGEVGQRDPVAGARATLVDSDVRIPGVCLPTAPFGLVAVGELGAKQTRPELPSAVGIICGKLDEDDRSVHRREDNAERPVDGVLGPGARDCLAREPSRRR